MKNEACLIGQSGGPTAVINSSLLGVIDAAKKAGFTKIYGAACGIIGILNNDLYDLSAEDSQELKYLINTPSAALGSCRYKVTKDSDFEKMKEIFEKHNIRYFFYNGGNDSMDTCHKLHNFFVKTGYECNVIGIPKTIDNDLVCTDHCPGFGSAVKFISTVITELTADASVYGKYGSHTVTVVEIMGRNAGWLTGAAALAKGTDLIYLPEVVFDTDKFISDIKTVLETKRNCMVAVSEGIKDKNGKYITELFAEKAKDAFGHVQMGGAVQILADLAKKATGAKVRGIELNLLQRSSAHLLSETDAKEAYLAGEKAVEYAINGFSGKMVAFECNRKPYQCSATLVNLSDVANKEKTVPIEWINNNKNGVTQDFINYVVPLMQGEIPVIYQNGLVKHAELKKIQVK